jgi:hypothetical protein
MSNGKKERINEKAPLGDYSRHEDGSGCFGETLPQDRTPGGINPWTIRETLPTQEPPSTKK